MLVRLALAGLIAALAGPAAAGAIEERGFASAALRQHIPSLVYVPDGAVPDYGWPVLYLLHGHDGNERSWVDLGNIEATLDRLISGGAIQPMLVVMPAAGNSWYVDSHEVGGPGDFETALTRDLIAAVEAIYPVRRDRGGRVIAGLSMGGYGALRLALAYPELYAATASLSGALWNNIALDNYDESPEELQVIQDASYFHRVDPETVTVGRVLPSVGTHFGGAYGSPFDAERFNRQNIFTLLSRQLAAAVPLPDIYITVGDDDGFHLWRGAMAFYNTTQIDRIGAELRITDGDHVWTLWAREIVNVLAFLDGHIEDPPPSR